MKITGYALREAIKQHELRRDTAAHGFNGSLKAFPGEVKDTPSKVIETFLSAETAIARLQVAQMQYNLIVTVTPTMGEKMSLAEAIKRVGGLGRVEKMWRSAAGPKKDRYGNYLDEDEIDPTRVRSKPTMTPTEAVKMATAAGKRAGALRAAIATSNATQVEIEGLDPELFE